MSEHSFGLIIPAAGKGMRMQSEMPKIFSPLGPDTVLQTTVTALTAFTPVTQVIIVTQTEFIDRVQADLDGRTRDAVLKVIEGGLRRQDSVALGFAALEVCDYVIIHDAVRPFTELGHIRAAAEAAVEYGGAVLGVKPKCTIKECGADGMIAGTPSRESLFEAQTPQIFEYNLYARGLEAVTAQGLDVTDDAQIVEAAGGRVQPVEGSYANIKLTTPEDLDYARFLMERRK